MTKCGLLTSLTPPCHTMFMFSEGKGCIPLLYTIASNQKYLYLYDANKTGSIPEIILEGGGGVRISCRMNLKFNFL